jgi:hypothetical protein
MHLHSANSKHLAAAVLHMGSTLGDAFSPTHITPWLVQEYIHDENQRLEEEQQFWSKEIVVRIEYKFCPNLTIIDTPGKPLTFVTTFQLLLPPLHVKSSSSWHAVSHHASCNSSKPQIWAVPVINPLAHAVPCCTSLQA